MRGGDAPARRVFAGGRLARSVVTRVPALVDPTGLVDQEVVADVPPALGDGVVVVDRPHGRGRIRVAVLRGGVMDDELLDRPEHGRPGLLSGAVIAKRLVRAPAGPRN